MLKDYNQKKKAGSGLKDEINDMFLDKVVVKFVALSTLWGFFVAELFHFFLNQDSYVFFAFSVIAVYVLKVLVFDWKSIKHDLENKKKGAIGEVFVGDFLQENFKNENSKIINDLVLEKNDKTFNIDHILINKKGIFVIETKNQENWKGNEKKQYGEWMIQVKAQIGNVREITGEKSIFGIVVRPEKETKKNSKYKEVRIINEKFIKSFIDEKVEVFSKKEIEGIYEKLNKDKINLK